MLSEKNNSRKGWFLKRIISNKESFLTRIVPEKDGF
jgi:hypothetical protein